MQRNRNVHIVPELFAKPERWEERLEDLKNIINSKERELIVTQCLTDIYQRLGRIERNERESGDE